MIILFGNYKSMNKKTKTSKLKTQNKEILRIRIIKSKLKNQDLILEIYLLKTKMNSCKFNKRLTHQIITTIMTLKIKPLFKRIN